MNILIIKTGALGDVVRSSFLAQALKDKYCQENPKLFWLVSENAKPLLLNNPYIDVLLTENSKNELRKFKFDLILNLEEGFEICRFVSSLKYYRFIGFVYKDNEILPTPTAKEWFDMSALGRKPENDILKKKNRKTHRQILSEMAEIKDYKRFEPLLRLTKSQRALATAFLRRHNLSRTDLIIGINTGSADRWPKQLSIEKSAKLINQLHEKLNASIILFGGPNEVERNRQIIALSRAPVITAGCGNDLFEFPALISVCSLIISTDSLCLHISMALKRKTIALIGPTSSSEIDMYNLGEKVIADSKCVCCYSPNCKSMEKISIEKIISAVNKTVSQRISVVITAFKEPNISKAIEAALNQKTHYDYEVVVSAPDKETISIAKRYLKDKRLKIFNDPGKGKSYALNMIFSELKSDILIITDGDVHISENSVEDLANMLLDPEIGCVTGRPVPMESRQTKYGYWANFLFDSAHKIRKSAFERSSFLECSAYLLAFRKSKISRIPLDVAEDAIIPYYFWERGYKIGYAEKAQVYVKNVSNWEDWIKQKVRTSKAHETLEKYVDTKTTPRMKTFKTESSGLFWMFSYSRNFKELFWSIQLVAARFYMWMKVFIDTKLHNKHYNDSWERIESTK